MISRSSFGKPYGWHAESCLAGVITGMVWLQHNLAATGFANTPAGFSLVQGTSAGFDNTALGGQFIGLSVNPGASGAWVVEQCLARCWY